MRLNEIFRYFLMGFFLGAGYETLLFARELLISWNGL